MQQVLQRFELRPIFACLLEAPSLEGTLSGASEGSEGAMGDDEGREEEEEGGIRRRRRRCGRIVRGRSDPNRQSALLDRLARAETPRPPPLLLLLHGRDGGLEAHQWEPACSPALVLRGSPESAHRSVPPSSGEEAEGSLEGGESDGARDAPPSSNETIRDRTRGAREKPASSSSAGGGGADEGDSIPATELPLFARYFLAVTNAIEHPPHPSSPYYPSEKAASEKVLDTLDSVAMGRRDVLAVLHRAIPFCWVSVCTVMGVRWLYSSETLAG